MYGLAGLFINASTTYLYYNFNFPPQKPLWLYVLFNLCSYLLEVIAALYYAAMRPQLDTQIIFTENHHLGSLLILIIPSKGSYTHQSKTLLPIKLIPHRFLSIRHQYRHKEYQGDDRKQ
ncbi:MAG: hypothetical protein ACLUOS_16860 [Odoribacter splanchnicus]